MFDYVVVIDGRSYPTKAIGRNKAIYAAVREYKEETKDSRTVDLLAALASCTKIRNKFAVVKGAKWVILSVLVVVVLVGL